MKTVIDYIVRVFNYVVAELKDVVEHPEDYLSLEQLGEIEECFAKYGNKDVVKVEFLRKYPELGCELVELVVDKIDSQGGVLDPMDRLFLTILKD
jgi:hypothetical protein